MRLCLLLAAVLFAPIFASAQTTVIDSIQSGSQWRSYRIYLPANYNANTTQRPLVLNLHGFGSNAAEQEFYGDFRPIADTAGFLVVHPNGTFFNGVRFWNAGLLPGGTDDVVFLSALIDTLSVRYRVDAQRVFSTGMSNGGFMSYYLASYLSQKIAAIASVTGAISTSNYPPTQLPGHPMPVMQIHGTTDPTVAYNGGPTAVPGVSTVPIDTLVQFWRRFNACGPTPQSTTVPNTNTTDGCTAERFVYTGGNAGATVEFFKVTGGGHTWPGAPVSNGSGNTSQDFNASAEVWRFFRQYNRASLTAVRSAATPALRLQAVPNPASSELRIEGGAADGIFEVLDAAGRSVRTGAGTRVELDGLSSGAYLLRYTVRSGAFGSVAFVKQ